MSDDRRTDGGCAFPCEGGVDSGLYPDPGMSLRDWFAGQAMAAILKNYSVDSHDLCAANAYDIADAMLMVREDKYKP